MPSGHRRGQRTRHPAGHGSDSVATEIDDVQLQEALHEWHQQDIDVVDVIHILEEDEGLVKDEVHSQPIE